MRPYEIMSGLKKRRIAVIVTTMVVGGVLAAAQQPSVLPMGPARERGASVTPAYEGWYQNPDGSFNRTPASGGQLYLPTALTSDEILESFAPPETVGFWDLGRFISQMEEPGFSGLRHRLFLQSELAKPALFAAMVLIGAAFALRPTRFGQTGVMILLAVLAGFALYFLKDFAESLGGRGQIPLLVAAWTPPVAAIMLAVALLLHLEDG